MSCNNVALLDDEVSMVRLLERALDNYDVQAFTDSAGNVIIRKPASKGRESAVAVVMQSHLDMVPQKNNDTEHDFISAATN